MGDCAVSGFNVHIGIGFGIGMGVEFQTNALAPAIVESLTVHKRFFSGRFPTRILLAGAIAVTAASTVHAEFRLPPSEGEQGQPVVAADARGGTVVVWQERFPGAAQPLNSIRMQHFDPSGAPVGSNQRVDLLPGDNARNPAIDVAADGSTIVVWEGGASEGPFRRTIWARRFAPDGTPRGAELRINDNPLFAQRFGIPDTKFGTPAVSIAPDGGFVVVWRDDGAKTCNRANIVARRYQPDGTPRGPVFRVNAGLRATHLYPVVDHDAAGGFVVVWQRSKLIGTADELSAIVGQRFDSAGNLLDRVFAVATGDRKAVAPSLEVSGDGSFVVVWLDKATSTADHKILARRFAVDGDISPLIEVTSSFLDEESYPKLVTHTGGFTAVWSGNSDDRWVGNRIWMHSIADDGTPLGRPSIIGPGTCRNRRSADIAPLLNGALVTVWQVEKAMVIEGTRLDSTGRAMASPTIAPTIADLWPPLLPTEDRFPVVAERISASQQVGCFRFEAEATYPVLTQVFANDPSPAVRGSAAAALAMVTPRPRSVLRPLVEGTRDESPGVQEGAARGLGILGLADGAPALLDLLKESQSPLARARAASSLGDIASMADTSGELRKVIAGALREALDQPDSLVRIAAAGGLVRLPDPPDDLSRLIYYSLVGAHPEYALELIGRPSLGPSWPYRKVKAMMLTDPRPEVRAAAIRCLASRGYGTLRRALEDPSPLVRLTTADALRSLGSEALKVAGGEIEVAARNEIDKGAKPHIDAAWFALQEVECVETRIPSKLDRADQ